MRALRAGQLAALSFAAIAAAAVRTQESGRPPVPEPPPSNRLAQESSPYLRLHQHDPVDWYPWGPEAFAKARAEQKPIFVSIGYAACHWCHVMAHESFADAATAAALNADFVCIKVDREERPDVDELYMAAVQAMGVGGGWPLSVWLLPSGEPFFGGTYFPPEDAHGRPGFRRVLASLAKAWRERPEELRRGGRDLAAHLGKVLAPELPAGEPDATTLAQVLQRAEARFDAQSGGFAEPPGFAPKFPNAIELQVLLRLPDPAALPLVTKTLDGMRDGGLCDQLGGGFHRYTTDRGWRVPHFEKMLYDNALLVPSYLDAALRTGDPAYAATARATLDWLLRELLDPAGGFASSLDADSEGEEGRFYVWTAGEFDALLGDDSDFAKACFGVTAEGTWEGRNVLVRARALAGADVARLAAVQQKLLAARAARTRPATDDKVLSVWNGFAISALAAGYQVLGEPRYLAAALRAGDFARGKLVDGDRCWRSWRAGVARQRGFLDDQAALAAALLDLFASSGDPSWLAASEQLLRAAIAHFGAADGGFYFTADDHEALVARSKATADGATPSGAALAAATCLRLGLLLGDEALYERGLAVLRAGHSLLVQQPDAVPALVRALQFHLADPRTVVVAGSADDPRTQALLQAAWRAFPLHHVVARVDDGNRAALTARSSVFADKRPVDGVPAAYVCRRGVCLAPITAPAALTAALTEVPR